MTNKYISVPRDVGAFSPAAFSAGVVRGVVRSAGWPVKSVTAHEVDGDGGKQTTLLISMGPGSE